MPKLLQINVDATNGSNGGIARDIGSLVMKENWESYIAYGRSVSPGESTQFRIGNQLDVYAHGIESRIFDNHGLSSRHVTRRFIKKIEKIAPDIIHLHNIHGYFLNYKILFEFLKSANIPVVWTLHDCWAFTGHCAHFVGANCYKWQTGCKSCPLKKDYPSSLLFDRSEKNYRLKEELFNSLDNLTIVPVSHWLEDLVKQSFLRNNKIRTVLNGVDTDIYRYQNKKSIREKYNIGNKFLLLGVAANWTAQKGLYDYFELSKSLPKDCVILLIGLKKNQIENLPEEIIGIERTHDIQELVSLYSESDIVLNLSYEESFGMTTIEGLSCGTPGIVYNRTASPELISEDVGLIVEAGNIKQLLSAIEKIKCKGKKFYSEACRKRVIDNYDNNKCFKTYVSIYKELLSLNNKIK